MSQMILGKSLATTKRLLFCVFIIASFTLVRTPQAVAAATFSIPITIKGLPADKSVSVTIDGKQVGTISGGGTKSFTVDKKSSHTFQVDAQVPGICSTYAGKSVCSRYKNPNNVWTVDLIKTQDCEMVPVCWTVYVCDCCCCWWEYYCGTQQYCWTETELSEKGHTFEYNTEHEVLVEDAHGQNSQKWVAADSELNVWAVESHVVKDESNVKERDVFQDWLVNGVPMETRNLVMKIDAPYYFKAEYGTETQYRISLSSEFGNPTVDSTKGWYMKGQEAAVSVEKEVPMDGWMGALGGKEVFAAWRSGNGVVSKSPTYTFSVDEPVALRAEWRQDTFQPIAILGALIFAVAAALVVFLLYSRGRLFRAGGPGGSRYGAGPTVIQGPPYTPPPVVAGRAVICFGCGATVSAGAAACPRCGKPQ